MKLKNNISIISAAISGLIGLFIGWIITYLINWGSPMEQIRELLIAVGVASFFASLGGCIVGQMEILNRNNNSTESN